MTNTPFMQLYIADYLADTQHLTTEQNGAYLLLLMTMWRSGGSLPNDEKKLARIARVSLKRWHMIADEVMEFFDVDGDVITQKRLVEELQKAVSKSEKRKTSGRLGGEAKSLKNNKPPLANASDLPKHSSESDIRDIKKDTNVSSKKGCRLPEDFQPDFSIAIKEGFTEQQAQKLFANFKDYWTAKTGKDATKRDWQATWRNWVRSPFNQKFKGYGHARTNTDNRSTGQKVADAMRRYAPQFDARQAALARERGFSGEVQSRYETDTFTNGNDQADNRGGKTITLVACNHG